MQFDFVYVAIGAAVLLATYNAALGFGKTIRILAMRAGFHHWRRRAVFAEARVIELEESFTDRANLIESRWAMREDHLQNAGGRLATMFTRERNRRIEAELELNQLREQLAAIRRQPLAPVLALPEARYA